MTRETLSKLQESPLFYNGKVGQLSHERFTHPLYNVYRFATLFYLI